MRIYRVEKQRKLRKAREKELGKRRGGEGEGKEGGRKLLVVSGYYLVVYKEKLRIYRVEKQGRRSRERGDLEQGEKERWKRMKRAV